MSATPVFSRPPAGTDNNSEQGPGDHGAMRSPSQLNGDRQTPSRWPGHHDDHALHPRHRRRPWPLMLSVVFAVLAALGNAGASVLQHKADRDVPEEKTTGLTLLWHLVHRPVWLGGIAALVVAF